MGLVSTPPEGGQGVIQRQASGLIGETAAQAPDPGKDRQAERISIMTNSTTARVIFDATTEGNLGIDAIAQRFTPGQHRVIFNELDETGGHVWDWDNSAIVCKVIETSDFAEAQRLHREAVIASDSHAAAKLAPAAEAFGDDLAAYLRAVNTEARLSEELPRHGTWIGALTEDPAHWAEMGVKTPADLDAYLQGCFEREMQKEMMAG